MRIINKKYLLIILLVGIIITGFVVLKQPQEVKLDSVILKNEFENKSLAIMIEKSSENGQIKYEELKENKFPEVGYVYNKEKSKCIDNNGEEVENTIKYLGNGKVEIESNKTVYCYLYFDKSIELSKLCSNYDNLGECVINEENKLDKIENLYKDQGGMNRYQGSIVNNNYICFGTSDKDTCIQDQDKYMYRIIGITNDGKLKLLKNTRIYELNNNGEKMFYFRYGSQNWNESILYKRLNGISNGEIQSNNQYIGEVGDTNIFVNSEYFDYMRDNGDWYQIIDDYNLKICKEPNDLLLVNYYASIYERNIFSFECLEIQGKIILMDVLDYLYSYINGDGTNHEEDSSWITMNKISDNMNYPWVYEWLNGSYSGVGVRTLNAFGEFSGDDCNSAFNIRPVFFLVNTIKLSGLGTIDNPYLINIEA